MKSFLAVALATTALLAAVPSYAQNNSGDDAMRVLRSVLGTPPADPAERDLNDQERHISDVLQQSANERRIDRAQIDRAFGDLRAIHDQKDDLRGRHGGRLTQQDHDYIRDRLAGLDRQVDQMREAENRQHNNGRADNRHDQGRDRGDFWDRAPRSLDDREDWLEQKIREGMANGSLDRGEARNGLKKLASIRSDEARYLRRDRGHLRDDHRQSLTDRLDDLGRQLRWDRTH